MSDPTEDPIIEQTEAMDDGMAGGEGDSAFLAEPQRAGVSPAALVMFAVLLAAGGAFYYMRTRIGPASAKAATPEAAAAKRTITDFLTVGGQNISAMRELLKNTEKVVQQFVSYPSVGQVPLRDLRTNPFRFAAPKPKSDELEELARRKREQERIEVLKKVQSLQLQSIVFGEARRACMINGTLYSEGQEAAGFVIEKISQKAVVVKNGTYRFELRMQR